jgi:hypothetical protein
MGNKVSTGEELKRGSIPFPDITDLVTDKLHPSRRLKHLSGPLFFVFYPKVHGKKILLLGEAHSTEDICDDKKAYEVQNWLVDIARNAPECIDIMSEDNYETDITFGKPNNPRSFNDINDLADIAFPQRTLSSYPSPLQAVNDKFLHCRMAPGFGPLCSKVRYHYLDTRKLSLVYRDKFSQIRDLTELKGKKKQDNLMKIDKLYGTKTSQNALRLYRYILGIDKTKETKLIYNEYMKHMLGEKYNEYQEDYYLQELWKITDKAQQKLDHSINRKQFYTILIQSTISHKYNPTIFHVLHVLPMDHYALLRLFTMFDTQKDRGPKLCNEHEMKNVIIYAGAYHCQIYKHFIDHYFNIKPTLSIIQKDFNQCIELPYEFDFFHKN